MREAPPSGFWRSWPVPVRLFALAYPAWIAFSFSNSLLVFETLRQTLTNSMGASQPVGDLGVYALLAVRVTIELLLLIAVLKHQSRLAALVIGAQMIGRLLGVPAGVRTVLDGYYQAGVYLAGATCLSLAAGCLLIGSSRQWFAMKGRRVQDDAQDFS